MRLGFQLDTVALCAVVLWHWAEAYCCTLRVTGTWLHRDLAWILT
jgi:hypothetical protein